MFCSYLFGELPVVRETDAAAPGFFAPVFAGRIGLYFVTTGLFFIGYLKLTLRPGNRDNQYSSDLLLYTLLFQSDSLSY